MPSILRHLSAKRFVAAVTLIMAIAAVMPADAMAQTPNKPVIPDRRTNPVIRDEKNQVIISSLSTRGDSLSVVPADSLVIDGPALAADTLAFVAKTAGPVPGDSAYISAADSLLFPVEPVEQKFTFTPDPTRAVWMSALFPGLGQLYNRRYWKLPIVIGAFMGLGYATSWNNTMLTDYTRAYSDIMDNDPNTKSYMDFFAPTVSESDLDKTWLTNLLKTRKNYYRRNRDLCIICMVGVYLIAMVDAYVDAQLAHFDISPSLSMDIAPTLMPSESPRTRLPSVGVNWAFNF